MFKNLTDFSYTRTRKEALGFYIAYLVLIVVVAGLLGGIVGMVSGNGGFEAGTRVGGIVAVIFCLALSFTILSKKSRMSNFVLILVALFSGVLAFLGGGVLGLIPTAYLSTKR